MYKGTKIIIKNRLRRRSMLCDTEVLRDVQKVVKKELNIILYQEGV